jgi:ribonuclease J
MKESLSVIPLGGVEEIGGLNMTVYRYGDTIIVVDAGLMFPEEDMLGVDFAIQDFTYLLENKENIKAVFLTHGHEDHTGALPFLLKEINVPVYGTPLTLGLVQEKLREHHLDETATLMRVRPRETVDIGPFTVEFIRVTHSIVDGVALGIQTPLGHIVHTGDFKVDPTPVDGELLDFNRFTAYGEKGTLLLLSDSTRGHLHPRPRPHHHLHLLLQHPPHPAGHRRGRPPRQKGHLKRKEHRLQRPDSPRPGVPPHPHGDLASHGQAPAPAGR